MDDQFSLEVIDIHEICHERLSISLVIQMVEILDHLETSQEAKIQLSIPRTSTRKV